ncbi:MAG: hypothetical protein CO150_08300 [Nitrospirae bacterium CG_4_9_14_3_um_filter_53_35]|nr:MAG: hypothetical protein AUK29_07955 [Nitrospirae bacterium CG2_30_53_67]PIS38309.1 MAG: hypothetical protein COT35_01595 [Nitrospirae bacterium CG08_land_8_20_14_0_20_52_24]PIV84541.1 MAG: hypothetical protein COW52_07030 [Nitrospirae bacterium CG17_big_fil_post_rev_8_21_14_2_50_50_9]PIW84835.1 MAG: hypothetical protein COZ95_07705 [Nitrospirae bacterium CG_4_8_14_3_um_filter_50_41]PIX85657.1 MAG: hypothetical protein COZ32_07375 [Nitrospirae bacterium CG_4_10_14_3_um_filter_53_41]PJA7327
MKEKELETRISLLERELSVLVEELDKLKLDHRGELDTLRIEIETLKSFLEKRHSDFAGIFDRIKSETLAEKNPEWGSGQP